MFQFVKGYERVTVGPLQTIGIAVSENETLLVRTEATPPFPY